MVDEVKDSMDEPTPAVEPVAAMPEVPAIAVPELAAPVAELADKPVRGRKPKKVSAEAVEAPVTPDAVPDAIIAEPGVAAKPVQKPAKVPKTAVAKSKTGPRAAKLPAKAAAEPKPAVKPAIKRPFTATNRVKTPSVKTFVGSAKAPTAKKELFAMAITTPTEFTDKMQSAFKDAQEKAKATFGDAGSFAKGNVEAMVESTKILASGLQDMTKGYVEETKTSFETMTADVKDLAAVKSPTEFFEKQSALMRKNFDAAVAASSKNSEAMLKLINEAFQPISTRVSLAVEKIKHAA